LRRRSATARRRSRRTALPTTWRPWRAWLRSPARRSARCDARTLSGTRSLRVAVLGVGLIGGSIGLAARQRAQAEVLGYDRDAAVLERARKLGAIDRAAAGVADAVAEADAVFVAT